jgi:uncharacterized membrane protein YdjX (TVP38/TMEM64 family)
MWITVLVTGNPSRRHDPEAGTVGRVKWWRALAGAVVVLAAVGAAVLLVWSGGIHDVRRAIESSGAWAPVLFVLLQVVVTITPLPRTVFTVAAGVLFGTVAGLLLTVAATALAAVSALLLVRMVGGGFARRHAHRPGVAWVRSRLDHSGLLAVVSLRLIPAVPFAVMNYAAGLAGVRLFPFVVGTVLGVLPGTVAVVVLGDAVSSGNAHPALFAVSLAGGLLGLAGASWAARRGPAARSAPEPEPEAAV